MRETYACADKVLVLDTVLSQVSKTADAAEILMSIRSSSWVRRLWTFHEAGLAKALYYQFSDHVLKNNEIYMTAAMEEFDRTIRLCQRENWDPSLLDSEVHPVDIDKEMGTAYNISRSISERMVNLSHIKAEAFRYLAVIEADAIKQHDPSNYRLLCQATRPLRWRSTSRIEDETICIAGVLGLDVAGLVGLNHIERMKRLLGQMKYVPADILFLDKPRIQGVGFRWMPTTFLGMGNDAGMSIAQAAEPTNDGLIVTTPGMVIFAPFRRALVRIDDLDLRRSRAFMNGESLFTKNDGRVYGISPLNSSFKWSDYNTTSIVIIWSLESRAKSIRTGQIVQVDKQENGTIYCHIECQILIVSWTADELKERFSRTWEALTFTDSEPLLTTQRWCVG
jgi:hypothetical protein